MKLFKYSDYRNANRVKREPLFEIAEIADRLKLDEVDLRNKVKSKHRDGYPTPPKPAIPRRVNCVGGRPQLYKLSEFKKWLKELDEFNEEDAPL